VELHLRFGAIFSDGETKLTLSRRRSQFLRSACSKSTLDIFGEPPLAAAGCFLQESGLSLVAPAAK
jgi:hypothetical protein